MAQDCSMTCIYCEQVLAPRHEHDHAPIPKRTGFRGHLVVIDDPLSVQQAWRARGMNRS